MGVSTSLGDVQTYGGMYECMGHMNIGGIQILQGKKTCLPLRKVGKNPI